MTTKLVVAEALGAIVQGIGYPFGIVDKEFVELLKEDVIEAERRCHQPSAIDRQHYFEQLASALNMAIGTYDGITPIEK
jgi:hypothetical protein